MQSEVAHWQRRTCVSSLNRSPKRPSTPFRSPRGKHFLERVRSAPAILNLERERANVFRGRRHPADHRPFKSKLRLSRSRGMSGIPAVSTVTALSVVTQLTENSADKIYRNATERRKSDKLLVSRQHCWSVLQISFREASEHHVFSVARTLLERTGSVIAAVYDRMPPCKATKCANCTLHMAVIPTNSFPRASDGGMYMTSPGEGMYMTSPGAHILVCSCGATIVRPIRASCCSGRRLGMEPIGPRKLLAARSHHSRASISEQTSLFGRPNVMMHRRFL